MAIVRLIWVMLRFVTSIGLALVTVFLAVVLINAVRVGLDEIRESSEAARHAARQAHIDLEGVLERQHALHDRRAELIEERRAIATEARNAAADFERAAREVEEKQASWTRASQRLIDAQASVTVPATSVRLRMEEASQLFGVELGDAWAEPERLATWLEQTERDVEQRCTFQSSDLLSRSRVSAYVAGNVISSACDARHALFRELRGAAAMWRTALSAEEDARERLAVAQSDVSAARAAQLASDRARSEQEGRGNSVELQLAGLDGEIAELSRQEAQLHQAKREGQDWEARFHESAQVVLRWLVEQWQLYWWTLLQAVLLVIALPYVWRAALYYVFSPWIARGPALTFEHRPSTGTAETAGRSGSAVANSSRRTATIDLAASERLFVRPEHVRQLPAGSAQTRWFLPAERWLGSWLLGFFAWTEVRGSDSAQTNLTLAASGRDSADTYLVRVDLIEHPGFIIHPRHVVALSDGLELFARWRFSWQSLAMGTFRFIQVRGTGTIWFEGYGDVAAGRARATEVQQSTGAYLGWDSRLRCRMCRREPAFPYIVGRNSLFELGIRGADDAALFVWQKSVASTGVSPLERGTNVVLSTMGKFFGF